MPPGRPPGLNWLVLGDVGVSMAGGWTELAGALPGGPGLRVGAPSRLTLKACILAMRSGVKLLDEDVGCGTGRRAALTLPSGCEEVVMLGVDILFKGNGGCGCCLGGGGGRIGGVSSDGEGEVAVEDGDEGVSAPTGPGAVL